MSQFPMMRGLTEVRAMVSAFLEAQVPLLIDVLRVQRGIEDWELPYPVRYNAYEINLVANDEYPCIGLQFVNDRTNARVDYTDSMQQEYWMTCQTQLFCVVRTPLDDNEQFPLEHKEAALQLRDDMTTVLKSLILQVPHFGYPNDLRMNAEESFSTDYLEPQLARPQSGRSLVASVINFELQVRQFTYELEYGTASTVDLDVDLLNP